MLSLTPRAGCGTRIYWVRSCPPQRGAGLLGCICGASNHWPLRRFRRQLGEQPQMPFWPCGAHTAGCLVAVAPEVWLARSAAAVLFLSFSSHQPTPRHRCAHFCFLTSCCPNTRPRAMSCLRAREQSPASLGVSSNRQIRGVKWCTYLPLPVLGSAPHVGPVLELSRISDQPAAISELHRRGHVNLWDSGFGSRDRAE